MSEVYAPVWPAIKTRPTVAGMRILIGLYALALGVALLAGGLRHKGGLAAARR